MYRTKTLDQILYKERHYPGGSSIEVEDKDVDKLVRLGAIPVRIESRVEINVIKNPIKAEEKVPQEIIFREDNTKVKEIVAIKKLNKEETREFIEKEVIPRVKRKYNKRGNNADTSSENRRDTTRFRK